MHHEVKPMDNVNQIKIDRTGETVFQFDLHENWRVASVTWEGIDIMRITLRRKEEDE